jgi:hypothetical protein
MGTGALLTEVKWQGCEADHSFPSSAKVENGGALPPLPHMLNCIIKYRDNLTFTFYLSDLNDLKMCTSKKWGVSCNTSSIDVNF